MTFLLLMILAHMISDFCFQSNSVVQEKRELELRGFLKHGVVIFICTFTLLHFYGLTFALGFSFLVAIFHIGFDVLKVGVEKNINIKSPWFNVVIFIFDQIIHLCILFYLANIFIIDIDIGVINFYYSVLSLMGISYQSLRFLMSIFPLNKCLVITISYICILFGGAILTRMVIDNIFPQKGLPMKSGCIIIKPSSNQVGWYIGILERTIILTSVLYGSFAAVALVFTAKSIARFNELNNKDFAEYYIIGTLVSLLIAIGGGLLLKKIIPFF